MVWGIRPDWKRESHTPRKQMETLLRELALKASLHCTTELTMWHHSWGKKKPDKTILTLTKQLFLILL